MANTKIRSHLLAGQTACQGDPQRLPFATGTTQKEAAARLDRVKAFLP